MRLAPTAASAADGLRDSSTVEVMARSGSQSRVNRLRERVTIHLASADTFGTLDAIAVQLEVQAAKGSVRGRQAPPTGGAGTGSLCAVDALDQPFDRSPRFVIDMNHRHRM